MRAIIAILLGVTVWFNADNLGGIVFENRSTSDGLIVQRGNTCTIITPEKSKTFQCDIVSDVFARSLKETMNDPLHSIIIPKEVVSDLLKRLADCEESTREN